MADLIRNALWKLREAEQLGMIDCTFVAMAAVV
jgi:hypothetical protein